jgi:NAD(P)-dependent dehydrogenase (short-subunit alcohol dehydrogenase family)
VHATSTRFGPITGAAINMGHPPKGPLLDLSDADWHAGLDMAVMPAIRVARLLTAGMASVGGGAFVVVSSAVAFEPERDFPMSTLRAGLGAWVKLYADTYAKDAIRMNAILPGFTDSLPEKPDRRARIPAGRYGTVAEIANVAAFLLSDEATYVTGQNIRVDGGLTRSV